jgi:hypothetical protein
VLGIPRVAATGVGVVQNSHEHLSPTGELKVAGKVDRKLPGKSSENHGGNVCVRRGFTSNQTIVERVARE